MSSLLPPVAERAPFAKSAPVASKLARSAVSADFRSPSTVGTAFSDIDTPGPITGSYWPRQVSGNEWVWRSPPGRPGRDWSRQASRYIIRITGFPAIPPEPPIRYAASSASAASGRWWHGPITGPVSRKHAEQCTHGSRGRRGPGTGEPACAWPCGTLASLTVRSATVSIAAVRTCLDSWRRGRPRYIWNTCTSIEMGNVPVAAAIRDPPISTTVPGRNARCARIADATGPREPPTSCNGCAGAGGGSR